MTDLLKDLLHERADRVSPVSPDFDAIIATGDRTVRRHRVAGALGGLAAATVVGVVASYTVGLAGGRPAPPPIAAGGGGEDVAVPLTYATGSVIHAGDQEIDTGRSVRSLVRTDAGFAFVDRTDSLWFTDGGAPEQIGADVLDRRIVADDTGGLVGWVESPAGSTPEFVVYDTGHATEVLRSDEGTKADAARMLALDDGAVYWLSTAGVVRHDLASDQSTVLEADGSEHSIVDVANGMIAYRSGTEAGSPGDQPLMVGTSMSTGVPIETQDLHGYLSPDGSRMVVEHHDTYTVFDTSTGKAIAGSTAGYSFSAGVQWLDDDTVMVVAMKGPQQQDDLVPLHILACTVSTDTCKIAVPGTVSFPDLALPVGEDLSAQ